MLPPVLASETHTASNRTEVQYNTILKRPQRHLLEEPLCRATFPAGPSVARLPARPGVPASCRPGRSGRRGPPAPPPRRPGPARGDRPSAGPLGGPASCRPPAAATAAADGDAGWSAPSARRTGRPGTPSPAMVTTTPRSAAVTRTLTTPRPLTRSTAIATAMEILAWYSGPLAMLKRRLTR